MRIRSILSILFVQFLLLSSARSQTKDITAFLDSYTDSMLTQARQPGLFVSITQGDKIIYEKAKGFADISSNEPMDTKMRIRIGSLTKTFTLTVLLQLVDEGLLNLDDPISKWFNKIPNSENITVRMLGNMSSGLVNYSETPEFNDSMNAKPLKKWYIDELIYLSIIKPVYFSPGTSFHYSNTNTVLIGALIELITKNKLGDEFKKRIFDPLNLKDTEYPVNQFITGYHSHGYNEEEDAFIEPLTDVTQKYDPSWAGAAGAIISTLADMKIYLKALAEGKLTSEALHNERMKWSLNTPDFKYGLGLFKVGESYLGHNGSYPGFHNMSVHSPVTNTTVVIFYNTQSNRNPDDLMKRLIGYLE